MTASAKAVMKATRFGTSFVSTPKDVTDTRPVATPATVRNMQESVMYSALFVILLKKLRLRIVWGFRQDVLIILTLISIRDEHNTEATDDRISRSLPVDYIDASQTTRSNHQEWFEVKVLHERGSYRTGHEKSETWNEFDMNSTQLNFRKLFHIISGRCSIFSLKLIKRWSRTTKISLTQLVQLQE